MPVNWKSPDAFERLLAAMVAAQDLKLDYRKIATYYGQSATYDSIEGRFRIIKKQAAAMKHDVEAGLQPQAPHRGSGSSASTTSFTNGNGAVKSENGSFASGGEGVSPTKVSTPRKPRSTNTATPTSGRGRKGNMLPSGGDHTVNGRVAKPNSGLSGNGAAGSPTKAHRGSRVKLEGDDEILVADSAEEIMAGAAGGVVGEGGFSFESGWGEEGGMFGGFGGGVGGGWDGLDVGV